ncbi:MAG: hypothetical protein ACXQS1_04880, partial [Methermicoccaceae archaeon]
RTHVLPTRARSTKLFHQRGCALWHHLSLHPVLLHTPAEVAGAGDEGPGDELVQRASESVALPLINAAFPVLTSLR